jgi:hypothetical protein
MSIYRGLNIREKPFPVKSFSLPGQGRDLQENKEWEQYGWGLDTVRYYLLPCLLPLPLPLKNRPEGITYNIEPSGWGFYPPVRWVDWSIQV